MALELKMFVCGPTVYDYSHLGHGRTYLFFDLVAKFLRAQGHSLFYLQNITDIDDKIIARAIEEGLDWRELAAKYEKEYYQDMATLAIDSVSKYARASEHIPEIISQIEALFNKGYAYRTNLGIYFDISKFSDYGKLSGQNLDKLEPAERTEENSEKKNPHDFVLWKTAKESEPSWPSPFGAGRPGWHIEDTAITEKYLGPQYDIHGGGIDLIFPHHECEIAQQEAISGKKPMVNKWLHVGFLQTANEKMSKSLGNQINLREVIKEYGSSVFRLAMFSSHYRSPIEYSDTLMLQAKESLARLKYFVEKVRRYENEDKSERDGVDRIKTAFWTALEDDFNTPRALASLFDLVKETHKKMDHGSGITKRYILEFMDEADKILGLKLLESDEIPEKIKKLADERETARQNKDWQKADELRLQIKNFGYDIEDTENGPLISPDV